MRSPSPIGTAVPERSSPPEAHSSISMFCGKDPTASMVTRDTENRSACRYKARRHHGFPQSREHPFLAVEGVFQAPFPGSDLGSPRRPDGCRYTHVVRPPHMPSDGKRLSRDLLAQPPLPQCVSMFATPLQVQARLLHMKPPDFPAPSSPGSLDFASDVSRERQAQHASSGAFRGSASGQWI